MTITFFRRFRMEYLLQTPLFDVTQPSEEYSLHPWCDALLPAHAQAKYSSFRNELDVNVFPCLGDFGGCLQLMREIVTRNGFAAESTWLIGWKSPQRKGPHYPGLRDIQPVGTIQGIVNDPQTGTIQNIGVAPEHRGRGLGKLLIGSALAGFKSLGLSRAVLEVTAHNTMACRLYERLGFRHQRVVYKFQDVHPEW